MPLHNQSRPLSPHLDVYRWTVTMAMSTAHRITGLALYGGHAIIVGWLVAMAATPGAYEFARGLALSPVGLVVMVLYSWALFHHMCGGIRHFVWDTGHGMAHPQRDWLAWGTLIGGVVLTALFLGRHRARPRALAEPTRSVATRLPHACHPSRPPSFTLAGSFRCVLP